MSKKKNNSEIINELLSKAVSFHRQNKHKNAENLYLDVIKKHKNNPDANHNLAILKVSQNKFNEASPLFKIAIQTNPYEEQYWISYVDLLLKEKKFKDAKEICKKALLTMPNSHIIYNSFGISNHYSNDLKQAEINFNKSIELKKDFFVAYYNLGNLFSDAGRYKEAEIFYKKAIEYKPDLLDALNNLGLAQEQLGDLDKAEESYNKIIEINPNYKDALLNKGKILFMKGEYESSLEIYDSCNSAETRAKSLISLYALGRINEIYKRIEEYSKSGNKNIAIAAFASFISTKEKKDTSYNFCNNPLDFIHFSNFNSIFENANHFIDTVIEELNDINTLWEPYGRTTRNGFHSGNKLNIFNDPQNKLAKLKSIIFDEIDLYHSKFLKDSCSFIQNWPLKKELTGWYVILKKQGYQIPHYHPGGWLSGVVYLKVVPSLEKDEGAIEFSLNGQEYYDENLPKKIHKPKSGDIVLFPSSLHHRTIPFTTDRDRIVVAFDLHPY